MLQVKIGLLKMIFSPSIEKFESRVRFSPSFDIVYRFVEYPIKFDKVNEKSNLNFPDQI